MSRLLLLAAAATDEEHADQARTDQERRPEASEQSLAGFVGDLADRVRGARDEVCALARRVLEGIRKVLDAVLERVLRHVPLARRFICDGDVDGGVAEAAPKLV